MKHTTDKHSFMTRYFAFLQRRSIGDRLIFHTALIFLCASLFYVVLQANTKNLTTVPGSGGTLVEGIVGTPRFVNPVLAITRADHDMVALIYSGLLKLDTDGNLVPDLAESITRSEDGRTYNIKIRQNVQFHDGTKLTARDVAYTIGLIQNPDLKSPLRGNWEGVLVEELGEYELNIVLEEAYTPFIENFTVGILPRELWDTLPTEQLPFSQNNTEPIGTGPYYVSDALRSKSGLINAYKLSAYNGHNSQPKIDTLVFNFYQTEEELLEALQNNEIASTPSLSPATLAEVDTTRYNIVEKPLPRTFSLFLNQNRSSALRDNAVREALSTAINRDELIAQVLNGYGIPIMNPVPPGFVVIEPEATQTTQSPNDARIEQARSILENGGWNVNEDGVWEKEIDEETVPLRITMSTANTSLFDQTATVIQQTWEELGVVVSVDQYEQTDLVQAIIRPRSFEVLLFGNDIGRSVDLYPFWHSSQKDDPGLNIAQYTNIDADVFLETARETEDTAERMAALTSFATLVENERPAIFLFTPTFSYVVDNNVALSDLGKLSTPSERFANIETWYMTADALWPVFNSR
tara:strand:+ start:306 stop:2042 length:1737 start_codon:yes stop_codon:yes gene_type:complete